MPRLSLRAKLLVSVLVALLPVLALFVYDYFTDFSRRTETVLDSQMQTTQTVAVLVDSTFASQLDLAWAFFKDPVILTFDPNRIDPYLRDFAPLYPEISDIAVFAADGSNVGSFHRFGEPRPNVADREYFQVVMTTNAPYISDLVVSRATGSPVTPVAVPIRDQDGKPIGVINVALDVDYFPNILAPVHPQPGQNIFIADRTGRLAFSSAAPDLPWDERDVSSNPFIREAFAKGEFRGISESGILQPEPRIIAAIRASESGWIAGITVPEETALAPLYDALRVKFFGYVTIVLLGILGALWIAEQFLGPLRRLRDVAVALGRGQVQQRVKIQTGDELQTVGEAFNAMAEEVQRALQLREEFITVASHELRTPLTTIRGYAQLLLREEKNEEHRKALQTIVRSTERLDDLVQDMLEISRIRAEGVRLDKTRFDISRLVADVADRMQLLSPRHRLIVRARGPLEIEADPDRLEMVLTNLIDNATRYSPRGGDVEIGVDSRDHEAEVTVTDYGLGIPKEKQREVFAPFFQVHPAIAGFGGMGLGLYLSKQIVEAHGGRIWFESEEGKGSSFHLSLPADYFLVQGTALSTSQ